MGRPCGAHHAAAVLCAEFWPLFTKPGGTPGSTHHYIAGVHVAAACGASDKVPFIYQQINSLHQYLDFLPYCGRPGCAFQPSP